MNPPLIRFDIELPDGDDETTVHVAARIVDGHPRIVKIGTGTIEEAVERGVDLAFVLETARAMARGEDGPDYATWDEEKCVC